MAERSDDPVVVAALTKVVREDGDLRHIALSSLALKAAPEALAVLREYRAVSPLMRMGEPGKEALLEIQATSPRPTRPRDTDLRVWALEAACEAFPADAKVRARAAQELQNPDVRLRAAGVKCQRLTLGQASIQALRDLVKSADQADVRMASAGELGKLGDGFAYDAMMRVLQDVSQSRHDRCGAAFALGEIGNGSAYPALRDAVHEGIDCADVALKKLFVVGDPRRDAR